MKKLLRKIDSKFVKLWMMVDLRDLGKFVKLWMMVDLRGLAESPLHRFSLEASCEEGRSHGKSEVKDRLMTVHSTALPV